jgi:TPR repeat protein
MRWERRSRWQVLALILGALVFGAPSLVHASNASRQTEEGPETAFESVMEKMAAQHYMEARSLCNSILKKYPDYARCYNLLGFYYERIRLDFDKAFNYYMKAMKLGFFKAYVNFGRLAIDLARLQSEKGLSEKEASRTIIAASLLIEGALKLRATNPDYDTSSMESDIEVARRFLEPLAEAGNAEALDTLQRYFPSD